MIALVVVVAVATLAAVVIRYRHKIRDAAVLVSTLLPGGARYGEITGCDLYRAARAAKEGKP